MEPMQHRVFVILPTVYRLWGKVRLRHLEPWVEKWTLDEIYAGVSGQGAEDAAYATAVLMEDIGVKKEHVMRGAADIYKWFDQVLRPLVYSLLEEAGMPKGLLEAYNLFKNMYGATTFWQGA